MLFMKTICFVWPPFSHAYSKGLPKLMDDGQNGRTERQGGILKDLIMKTRLSETVSSQNGLEEIVAHAVACACESVDTTWL